MSNRRSVHVVGEVSSRREVSNILNDSDAAELTGRVPKTIPCDCTQTPLAKCGCADLRILERVFVKIMDLRLSLGFV